MARSLDSTMVPTKFNNFSDNKICLKFLAPIHVVDAFTEKGREYLSNLREEYNLKFKFSAPEKCYLGTVERICYIFGTAKNVKKFIYFLTEKLEDFKHNDPERHKQLKFLVPSCMVSMIIGKNGSYICKIQEISNAKVNVSPQDSISNEQCVTITGEMSQAFHALDFILGIIVNYSNDDLLSNVNYQWSIKTVLRSSPAAAVNGGSGSKSESGSTTSKVGNSSSDCSDTHASPLKKNSSALKSEKLAIDSIGVSLLRYGFDKKGVDEVTAALTTLTNANLLKLLLDLEIYGDNPLSTFANILNIDPSKFANINIDRAANENDDDDDDIILPVSRPVRKFHLPKIKKNDSFEVIQRQLQCPGHLIGHIIGKEGHSIKACEKESGAKISVSDKEVYVPNTRNRIIYVKGNKKDVDCACERLMHQIYKKVSAEPESNQIDEPEK